MSVERRMPRIGRAPRVAFALVAAACATIPVESNPVPGESEISVFAYTGLVPNAPRVDPPTVHLVADVTSLAGPDGRIEASGDAQLELARRLSVGILPAETPVRALSLVAFDRLGERPSSRCEVPRGAWAATALDRLRERLASEAADPTPHVVLIADIARECEPDLCRASRDLVAAGGWLDVVSLGAARSPECLRGLRPTASRPGKVVRALTTGAPRFRVERADGVGTTSEVLATGVADGQMVRVPSGGLVRVVVEFENDTTVVGPFAVESGERARVRISSFPLSARSERSWVVDVQ